MRKSRRGLAACLAVLLLAGTAAAATVECVLARINGDIITLSEFRERKKSTLEELYRLKLADEEMQRRLQEAGEKLLPDLIEERLLLQKARDLGLQVTKDEVDRILKSIMDQNKLTDEAGLEKALRSEGMTVAELRANIERRTLMEKLKQVEIASKVVVTDEEAQRYYDAHRDEFREPERVRLREIVLLLEKRDAQQVRKQIEELGRLVKNGADFAELATLFSQAPSAERGGDLGLVRTGDLAPEIAAVAAKLAVGEISAPIETRFGYHVLTLLERKPVSYRSVTEARDDITRKVAESRYGDKMKEYVETLKKTAFIEVREECRLAAK